MKVIRATEGSAVDRTGAAIFEGQVTGRTLLVEGDSSDFNAAIVQFSPGARTRLHRHASDQLLYIVAGIGQVGTAAATHTVGVGDLVIVPAGEDHWHGAGGTGHPMAHLTITRPTPGGETIIEGAPGARA
jgi:quercetin dioxygenase-like cupin family protein